MLHEKERLLANLTGVNSSKLNYYIELKKRNKEIVKQNNRLEIIHQLVRDINIDMTIKDIVERVHSKLPMAIPCDFLGLVLLRQDELYVKAALPPILNKAIPITRDSFLWKCVEAGKACIYDPIPKDDCFIKKNPALESQIRTLAVVPLFVKTAVQGVLLVGSRFNSTYSLAELNFVRQLADQLAICILNAKLYKQVSRAKSEWEATFNALTEPILLIDKDFNILRSNDRHSPGSNLDEGEKECPKCFSRLWGRDKKCEECLMEEVIRTGKPVYKQVQMSSLVILDIYYYPVYNEQNQITAVIHHMKDVTEKTKMEAQLLQSARLAAIGEMAAGVAHELNNPMTVIIGTAQLMLREAGKNSDDFELLGDVVNCGLRCKKIIRNLLTFSKQDDRNPMAPTNMNEEMERALSLVQYQINRNKIEITQSISEELPKIIANGHQIQQVLINFLLNARDALEGMERNKKIELSTSIRRDKGGEEWVVVTVKDNGVGIAPENLTKIFNPFYTSKESIKGTGLGLSVSLGIAEAHGGCIEVDSTLGEGSTFSLVLPVEAEPA